MMFSLCLLPIFGNLGLRCLWQPGLATLSLGCYPNGFPPHDFGSKRTHLSTCLPHGIHNYFDNAVDCWFEKFSPRPRFLGHDGLGMALVPVATTRHQQVCSLGSCASRSYSRRRPIPCLASVLISNTENNILIEE